MFAVTVVGLLGVVALGTEVGSWYLDKRLGQNAVDAAAIAGALTLQRTGESATAASAVAASARDNGFVDGVGGVTVVVAPAERRSANSVRVTITQTIAPVMTGLFGMGTVNIENQASAVAQPYPLCGVSFGPLSVDGSTESFGSSNCGLASNSSITASGASPGVALVSASTCTGCSTPFFTYQPPVQNPFSDLDTASMSEFFTAASCRTVPAADASGTITLDNPANFPNNVVAYCDPNGLNTSSGTTLQVFPGTYILAGTNLNFTGGTVNCAACWISPTGGNETGLAGTAGVTFVVTGSYSGGFSPSTTGTISISNTTITMNSPQVSATNPPLFNGVLFYRDAGAGDPGCNSVSIGLTAGTLAGGMYFPNSCASFSAAAGTATCSAIFANTLSFPGEAALDDTDCGDVGTAHPWFYATLLTE